MDSLRGERTATRARPRSFAKGSYQFAIASVQSPAHPACAIPRREGNIAVPLFIIPGYLPPVAARREDNKTKHPSCAYATLSRCVCARESLYKFRPVCYIGCFVSCTCIYYPRPTRTSSGKFTRKYAAGLLCPLISTSHLIYSR